MSGNQKNPTGRVVDSGLFVSYVSDYSILPSLKLTQPLKMDGWNTRTFPFGAWDGLFSGAKWLASFQGV